MSGERDWRAYESQIFEQLKKVAGDDATVELDVSLPGRFSRADRQVDVYVEGNFAGKVSHGTMAVDCKCFSRRVDVKDVETFIGLVEDVGTDFGLLVTTEGYSEAARNRAEAARGVKIDIVPYEELSEWEPPFQFCDVCTDWSSDRMPGGVYIDRFGPKHPGAHLAVGAGRCDRCQAIYMECSCGTINYAVEAEEGQWLECEGGCGVEWKVEVEVDRKGMPLTIDPHEQIEFRRRAGS
jgi:hypothetical protein